MAKQSQKSKHTQDNKSQDNKSQDNKSHHTHKITKGHDTRMEKKIQKLRYRDFMQEGQLANILKK